MAKYYKAVISTTYTVEKIIKAESQEAAEEELERKIGGIDLMNDDDPQVETTVYENSEDYDDDDVDFDTTSKVAKEIEKSKESIRQLCKSGGGSINIRNNNGNGVVLGSCLNFEGSIEVFAIYGNLEAETNFGRIGLGKFDFDEYDWHTLENVCKDAVIQ